MTEIDINAEFKLAKEIIDNEENLLISGKAGTGKSTLLKWLTDEKNDSGCNTVVLAPTGLSAININGQTIHSFFQFSPNLKMVNFFAMSKRLKDKIGYVDLFIIDEISMVRADLLDLIDEVLQFVTDDPSPFGGKQVVFIGDLHQLPPVLKREDKEEFYREYPTEYFFSARVMSRTTYKRVELSKVYRQDDLKFVNILSNIRSGTHSKEDIEFLNKRVGAEIEHSIYLTAINAQADEINERKLQEIDSKMHSYEGKSTGLFKNKEKPAPEQLDLKEGCQIMTVTNSDNWVNGTIATVTELLRDTIVAVTEEGLRLYIKRNTWNLGKYEVQGFGDTPDIKMTTVGTYKQFPVRLAWAVTIHKSQGQTFEKAKVDLSRVFTAGQTYVALSRLRSYEGLSLITPLQSQQIITDHRVAYYLG